MFHTLINTTPRSKKRLSDLCNEPVNESINELGTEPSVNKKGKGREGEGEGKGKGRGRGGKDDFL